MNMAQLLKIIALFVFIKSLSNGYPVVQWTYSEKLGGTNYDFGLALGKEFSIEIRERLSNNYELKMLVKEFGEATGNPLYSYFISTHENVYPNYMDELRGISEGSNVPFDEIFINQMQQEFSYFSNGTDKDFGDVLTDDDHCSDLILCKQNGDVFIAHNEDASSYDVNKTILVEATNGVNGGPSFTALVYLGQTPSNAFGFNANGVIFTMNKVSPKYADHEGLGRVFIGRSLLDTISFNDAVDKTTTEVAMIAGHNYQIGLAGTTQIVNIEVASFNQFKVTKFDPGDYTFFHANMYQMMDVPQMLPQPSSQHRIARFQEMHKTNPIRTTNELLEILGDQEDNSYPIYHDSISHSNGDLSGYTLVSILVDLPRCKMLLYEENPKLHDANFELDICNHINVSIVQI